MPTAQLPPRGSPPTGTGAQDPAVANVPPHAWTGDTVADPCVRCGKPTSTVNKARFCSPACRQAAYKARSTGAPETSVAMALRPSLAAADASLGGAVAAVRDPNVPTAQLPPRGTTRKASAGARTPGSCLSLTPEQGRQQRDAKRGVRFALGSPSAVLRALRGCAVTRSRLAPVPE